MYFSGSTGKHAEQKKIASSDITCFKQCHTTIYEYFTIQSTEMANRCMIKQNMCNNLIPHAQLIALHNRDMVL